MKKLDPLQMKTTSHTHVHRWTYIDMISDPDSSYYSDAYDDVASFWECRCGATRISGIKDVIKRSKTK